MKSKEFKNQKHTSPRMLTVVNKPFPLSFTISSGMTAMTMRKRKIKIIKVGKKYKRLIAIGF